jgi:hypothetical protein
MAQIRKKKNTVKCILTGNRQKPRPAEIHRWIADNLKLTIDHIEAIQLDTLEGAVYIKFISRHQTDNLLMATSGKSFLQGYDGTKIEIMLVPADLNTVTVRVFNVPLEMGNERITEALSKYGKIHDIRNEKLSTAYAFPIYSGIRAIKMEVKTPIPSRVYIAGYKAFITYDGQQQCCYYCNETTHIRLNCPARQERMTNRESAVPRTFSEVISRKSDA